MLLTKRSAGGAYGVLTFDDGLKNHFDYVAPVLQEFGINALFFVNTMPWSENMLLPVHKAHLLSAAFSYLELSTEFEAEAQKRGVVRTIGQVEVATARSQYKYDDDATAQVKYYLNAVIPQSLRAEVLNAVFSRRLGADRDYVEQHYLSPQAARELYGLGHTVSAHTHCHLHLASASTTERHADLRQNIGFIQQLVTGNTSPLSWISYPYGGPSSYNDEVIADARALGFELGVTMKRGLNLLGAPEPMLLKRVDTNDALGGKNAMSLEELVEL
ncbi:MAG: polysaccharide deacetylase family protein [Desulfobaccales bacterium]